MDEQAARLTASSWILLRHAIGRPKQIAGHLMLEVFEAVGEHFDYHARLLEYVRRYRADRSTEPIVRQKQALAHDPHFAAAERTFHSLRGMIDYCNRLPAGLAALAARFFRTKQFPLGPAEGKV